VERGTGGEQNLIADTVFELRQYTLYRGQRETLISLFEENFIEPQEIVGAHVVASFRDLDDPDRFVWLRGFQDMRARKQSLEAFYGSSPAWNAHKKQANATMIDSDNVLLLGPLSVSSQLPDEGQSSSESEVVYGMTIYYLGDVNTTHFAEFFNCTMLPHLNVLGADPIAILASNELPNNFPRLPIRENDHVFLWMARWPNERIHQSFSAQLRAWSGWRDTAPKTVLPALMRKPEQLRLTPTTRSRLQ
jgi:hypothetical protein